MTREELFALPFEQYMAERNKKLNKSRLAFLINEHPEVKMNLMGIWMQSYYEERIKK